MRNSLKKIKKNLKLKKEYRFLTIHRKDPNLETNPIFELNPRSSTVISTMILNLCLISFSCRALNIK